MGIKALKRFDPNKDKKFETWLDRAKLHFVVNKCLHEDKTISLLLLLDGDSYKAAINLGLKSTNPTRLNKNSKTIMEILKQKRSCKKNLICVLINRVRLLKPSLEM